MGSRRVDSSRHRHVDPPGRPWAASRVGLEPRVAPPEAESDPARRHGRGLIPAIAALLALEGLAVADLDAVAVGLGPGSYTGLRIGLTAAKTLAYAAGKPLVPLDSLEAIARNAPDDARQVVVAVDAQRGDAYLAEFGLRDFPRSPLSTGSARPGSRPSSPGPGPSDPRPSSSVPPSTASSNPGRRMPDSGPSTRAIPTPPAWSPSPEKPSKPAASSIHSSSSRST